MHKELKKYSEKENKDRKNRDPDDRDPDIENNEDATMHRPSEKRKSARKDYGDDKDASKSEQLYFNYSLLEMLVSFHVNNHSFYVIESESSVMEIFPTLILLQHSQHEKGKKVEKK